MDNIKSKSDHTGTLLLLAGCTLWGLSGTCGQYLFSYKGVSSGWLVMVRTIVSGSILSVGCLVRGNRQFQKIWRNRRDVLQLLVFSICGLLLSQYSYLTAVYYTNAGTATILQQVSPVFIIFIVCIRELRLPVRRELICIALALAGTFLIATRGNPGSLAISGKGLFWGMMSAVAVVTYSMTSQRLTNTYGSIPVMAQGMLIAGAAYTLISGQYRVRVDIDMQMLLPILGVVILGTAMAYTMYMAGVGRCGPFKASVLGMMEPVSAALFSYLWMGTPVTVYDVIGAIMIVCIIVIQNRTG